ncbi:MAG: nicotinate-nucleotide adenylyltransferase [Bacteroidota bacterium]
MSAKGTHHGRVGLFGGTFDPPHVGHLIIAEAAREQLGLERILFMPAAQAPHKRTARATPARHRLAMVRAAVRGVPRFHASDFEIRKGGLSYTVDTVRFLRSVFPRKEIWLLLGSDNLQDFFSWKEPGELLSLCRISVYVRPGFPLDRRLLRRTRAEVIEGGLLDLSSTLIRRLQHRRRSIRFIVPPSVEKYIVRHRLYGVRRRR